MSLPGLRTKIGSKVLGAKSGRARGGALKPVTVERSQTKDEARRIAVNIARHPTGQVRLLASPRRHILQIEHIF
jgi:hypothetical protein